MVMLSDISIDLGDYIKQIQQIIQLIQYKVLMSQHVPKGYKKWCEHCKLMIASNEMGAHLKSRRHLKNKQSDLDWSQQKHRKMREQEEKGIKKNSILEEIEKKAKLAMAQTDNDNDKFKRILKNEDDGNLEKSIRKNYEPGNFMEKADYSQTQVHRDETQQFIKPGKENLDKELSQVWSLIRCDETQKLCFYNNISETKSYTKPIGLKLSEFQEKQWNKYLQEKQDSEDEDDEDNDEDGSQNELEDSDDSYMQNLLLKEGIITEKKEKSEKQEKPAKKNNEQNQEIGMIQGQWEEVSEEDNYYNKYKAEDSSNSDDYERKIMGNQKESENQEEGEGKIIDFNAGNLIDAEEYNQQQNFEVQETELEKMQREIEEGKQVTEQEMIEVILKDQIDEEQGQLNKTKLKNENLKKMVEKNLELPSQLQKTTFKKQDFTKDEDEVNDKKVEKKGFKKRVLNNKKTMKVVFDNEND